MPTSVSAARPPITPRTPRQPLTDRHRAVWEFIAGRLAARGASPSYREVMAAFGIASPNGLACHLDALVKKGWLEVGSAMEARSFRVPGLAAFLAPAAENYLAAFRLADGASQSRVRIAPTLAPSGCQTPPSLGPATS
jgi:SOS-response transcriptional repressor LexA